MAPRKNTTARGKKSVQLLNALLEASQLLNSTLNLDEVLSILLGLATRNLGADRGTIYLVDREKGELWSRVLDGRRKMEIRLKLGRGIAGTVGKTGRSIVLKDAYKDRRFDKGFDRESGFRTRTMLCTPMKDRNGRIVGVFQILNKKRGYFSGQDERFLTALSIPASIALENARLYEADIRNQRAEKELEVASKIQQQLLPESLPENEGFEMCGITIPYHMIGGDFYDVIRLGDENLALVIADVTGHGVPAALLVSTLHACLHAYLELGVSLVDLVTRLNRFIHKNATLGKFITFVLAIYDPRARTTRYVNAGHNYPFVLRGSGEIEFLNKGGYCLGVIPGAQYEEGQLRMDSGDLLVMYTDGVTEAMNPRNELYGEERLFDLLKRTPGSGVRSVQMSILEDVHRHTEGTPQADDITMLLMKVAAPAAPP